jgi:arginine N-succinyltransferase
MPAIFGVAPLDRQSLQRRSLYAAAMNQATETFAHGRRALVVRPGRPDDAEGLHRLAKAAGSGMTNLQPDLDLLRQKLEASEGALDSEEARAAGAAILFVVERAGEVVGTACVFPRIGVEWPFYSYRLTRQAQTHRALRKTVAHEMLILANDFDGQAEVGGLFVEAAVRGAAAGRLAARARYLFLAEHRPWFGRLVISDMRGWQDADGVSPVWEALGREFYAMDFDEADRMNALLGNQFIADLSPKHPIYASLLPRAAREALGRPHDHGRGAMRLLLEEGFRHEGYVDIFDGGPTLCAEIDGLKAVRDCRVDRVAMIRPGVGAGDRLVSAGVGAHFRAARGGLVIDNDGLAELDETLARALGVDVGDLVRHVAF